MPLLSLAVVSSGAAGNGGAEGPVLLSHQTELSSVGFFARRTVGELMCFLSRQSVAGTEPGTRLVIDDKGYHAHVLHQTNGLAGVAVTDGLYPERIAFQLLGDTLRAFHEQYSDAWPLCAQDGQFAEFAGVRNALRDFQEPGERDQLAQLEAKVDATKEVMHRNLEELLGRGERLDQLVETSADLSAASKVFAKRAKKLNRCRCVVM